MQAVSLEIGKNRVKEALGAFKALGILDVDANVRNVTLGSELITWAGSDGAERTQWLMARMREHGALSQDEQEPDNPVPAKSADVNDSAAPDLEIRPERAVVDEDQHNRSEPAGEPVQTAISPDSGLPSGERGVDQAAAESGVEYDKSPTRPSRAQVMQDTDPQPTAAPSGESSSSPQGVPRNPGYGKGVRRQFTKPLPRTKSSEEKQTATDNRSAELDGRQQPTQLTEANVPGNPGPTVPSEAQPSQRPPVARGYGRPTNKERPTPPAQPQTQSNANDSASSASETSERVRWGQQRQSPSRSGQLVSRRPGTARGTGRPPVQPGYKSSTEEAASSLESWAKRRDSGRGFRSPVKFSKPKDLISKEELQTHLHDQADLSIDMPTFFALLDRLNDLKIRFEKGELRDQKDVKIDLWELVAAVRQEIDDEPER